MTLLFIAQRRAQSRIICAFFRFRQIHQNFPSYTFHSLSTHSSTHIYKHACLVYSLLPPLGSFPCWRRCHLLPHQQCSGEHVEEYVIDAFILFIALNCSGTYGYNIMKIYTDSIHGILSHLKSFSTIQSVF